MSSAVADGSFRDPSGFVFFRQDELLRQVNAEYKAHYEHLHTSGLYDALTERRLLVPHQEVDRSAALTDDAHVVIRPERVPFVSYPYEWCFSQLKAAAQLTLETQRLALEHGMTLKDASAYNVQFRDGQPVLIDTLSFEIRHEGQPWVAYRQFCQHFLAPLALMSMVDVRLIGLLRVHLDGLPLDLASALLPARTRLRPSWQIHLHQHAKAMRRHQDVDLTERRAPTVGLKSLRGLVESLSSAVRKLDVSATSHWARYYQGDSYSDDAFGAKQALVERIVKDTRPETVWDLGANTGAFSAIAAAHGAQTVAFEQDPAAVELHYRDLRRNAGPRVLPLVLDLTNPSPGIGWGNVERSSMRDRGPADLVLALALVHHIAIGNNVPIPAIAEELHGLARRLVIEFVPKSDPKTQVLLRARQDVFPEYTREGFEAAFAPWFVVDGRHELRDSDRVVYAMSRR